MGFLHSFKNSENLEEMAKKEKQEIKRREEKVAKRAQKPLLPGITNMLFVLFILWTVVAGVLDIFVVKTAALKDIVASIFAAALLLGPLVLAAAGVGLWQAKKAGVQGTGTKNIVFICIAVGLVVALGFALIVVSF